jgi:hypothetical protein
MQYHIALAEASSDSMQLEKICCDDKIDAYEALAIQPLIDKIFELAGRGLTLWLTCPKRTQKKNRPAATERP